MPNIQITKPSQNSTMPPQNTNPPTVGPIEGKLDLDSKRKVPAISVVGGIFELSFQPTEQIPQMTKPGIVKNNGRNFEFQRLPIGDEILPDCQVVVWVTWRAGTEPDAPEKIDFASVRVRIE
jgi:hypothetical protein